MQFKRYLIFYSLLGNVFVLAPAVYMLQIYDRILVSNNVFTLISLSLIVCLILLIHSITTVARKYLVEDEVKSNNRLFLEKHSHRNIYQLNTHADNINQYQIAGYNALLDIPWIFLYLCIQFLFYFWIGFYSLIAASIIFFISGLAFYKGKLINNGEKIENIKKLNDLQKLNEIRSPFNDSDIKSIYKQNNTMKKSSKQTLSFNYDVLLAFFKTAFQSLILGVSAYYVILGQVSPGMIIASSLVLARVLAPVQNIFLFLHLRRNAQNSLKIFSELPKKNTKQTIEINKVLNLHLHIKKLIKNERLILNNINLDAKNGDCILIIGENGSGKSVLLNEIYGKDTRQGVLTFNNIKAENIDQNCLNHLVGFAPSEINFFNDSIEKNITLKNEIDEKRLHKICKDINLHEYILNLDQGYRTPIQFSNDKYELSNGILQKINIARALYNDPKVILFDNPSSDLSNIDTFLFIEYLKKLKNKILIIASHDEKFLAISTHIMFLKKGKMVMSGTKEEILPKIIGKKKIES